MAGTNGFDFKLLNPPQKEAVRHLDGPLLILAGAGTGKTRTVIARIAWMLGEGIAPEHILAVTFTNKAATEMRERIAGMVSKQEAAKLTICTFHSLCVRILRGGGIGALGYKDNFSICAANDQAGLLRRILVQKGGKTEKAEARRIQSRISWAKNAGIAAAEMQDSFAGGIRLAYDDELKAMNAVDFDDLLLLAVRLLETEADIRRHWRERFQRVTVDEFQDTNSLQMRLLKTLVPEDGHVCVVGDDDQSIYGWRGAVAENILEFERFFPQPTIVKLEQNYRSTTPILHTANSLIRHNLGRRAKSLWSDKAGAERIRLIGMPGDTEEAEFVAGEIMERRHTEKRRWEDFAILIRTNQQSRLFEGELRRLNIPYRIIGGRSFYDRREIRDLLAFLAVAANADDDLSLLRVCNLPPRGISKATIGLANEESRARHCSVWQVIRDEVWRRATLGSRAANALAGFVALVERWGAELRTPSRPIHPTFKAMLDDIGYLDFLERTCETEKDHDQRREAISEFLQAIKDHDARPANKGLAGFLDTAALRSDKDDDQDIESQKGVCLITLHAAKGLEFPVVYLIGIEEGTLPHKRAIEENTRPEERRLFYVGITRAQESLTLTHCLWRKRYGDKVPCQPSSFLKELDDTYLDALSWDEIQAEPLSEEEAEATFSALYEMLGQTEED